MQIYVVSNLLRTIGGRVGLLLYLLCLNFFAQAAESPGNTPIEKDSLFSRWSKTKSTLPTLIYRLQDFNDIADRVEVESMIRTYGIGGVIVPNGKIEEVDRWITNNQARRPEPLIHVVEIRKIFELPFETLPDFPQQLAVEMLTSNQLVYQLGLAHAYLLKQTGIAIAEFSNIPTYYTDHEMKKVSSYLLGLSDGGIVHYFNGKTWNAEYTQGLANLSTLAGIVDIQQITANKILSKKTLKKYRKDHQDQRPVIATYQDVNTSVNQIENGVTLLSFSKKDSPQALINELLLHGMPAKNNYRRAVKRHFGLVSQVERQLGTPLDPVFKWENQQRYFKHKTVTLVQDSQHLVPIQHLNQWQLFTISDDSLIFESRVDRYKKAAHLPISIMDEPLDSLLRIIPDNALILVDFADDLSNTQLELLEAGCRALSAHRPVIAVGNNPKLLDQSDQQDMSVIWSPPHTVVNSGVLIEMVFGARAIKGALPDYMSLGGKRRGESRDAIGALVYEHDHLLDTEKLNQIESIVIEAISKGMMPGCQIMMVKDGQVVYDQNFGYLTYDSLAPVQWDHIYDIASVTKTVATLPVIMKDVESGNLSISGHLGDYLPAYTSTDKAALEVGDILAHQSGLKSYIPFWRHAKYDADGADFMYKNRIRRNRYEYQSISWSDSIQNWIVKSKYNRLSNDDGTYRYLYSDLGFMVMKDIVEANCACGLDQSAAQFIYKPMGMDHTLYNPLRQFSKEQIAPTELDRHFRTDLLQGVVHDKNAALLGGVSGHAGLFSNANDLAKYMYMMLSGGEYGGVQYFQDSLIRRFTSKKSAEDRRALGWDKPNRSVGNVSQYASEASFGHSGFTGTLVWADPEYDLIYVFLSNRIYPDPQNYKLIESNTRTKIHDLMYESFLKVSRDMNPDM